MFGQSDHTTTGVLTTSPSSALGFPVAPQVDAPVVDKSDTSHDNDAMHASTMATMLTAVMGPLSPHRPRTLWESASTRFVDPMDAQSSLQAPSTHLELSPLSRRPWSADTTSLATRDQASLWEG
jgi:hypothetical protein